MSDTASSAVSQTLVKTGFPSDIPLRRDPPTGTESLSSLPLAVSLVMIVLCLSVYLGYRRWRGTVSVKDTQRVVTEIAAFSPWTRWFKRDERANIDVIASAQLTQGHSVHVLQWQGKQILIGCAGQSMTVLATQPIPDEGAIQKADVQ